MTLRDYYTAVRPFYDAEMRLRTDLPEWIALARRLAARSVLDLGCGGGRVGAAIAADDPSRRVIGIDLLDVLVDGDPRIPFVRADMRALPVRSRFDLVIAANDPFAHLLDDDDRDRALAEAARVGAVTAIDGLYVRERDPFERQRDLGDGTGLVESWLPCGGDVFETRYRYTRGERTVAEAATHVRSWRADDALLRAHGARVAGGLDMRPFDPLGERFVIVLDTLLG